MAIITSPSTVFGIVVVVVVVAMVVVVVVLVVPACVVVVVVVTGTEVVVDDDVVVVTWPVVVVVLEVLVVVDPGAVVVVVVVVVVTVLVVVGGVVVVVVVLDAVVVVVIEVAAGQRQSAPQIPPLPHADPGGSQSSRPGVTVPSPQRASQPLPAEPQHVLQLFLKSPHALRSDFPLSLALRRHCRFSEPLPVQSPRSVCRCSWACERQSFFAELQLFLHCLRAGLGAAEVRAGAMKSPARRARRARRRKSTPAALPRTEIISSGRL